MFDYCSLHQEPRTSEEKQQFVRGLGVMHIMYTSRFQVLVTRAGESAMLGPGYFDRCWCLFEITLAIFAGTVLFDEPDLADFFLKTFFLPHIAEKKFTAGKADLDMVSDKFSKLIYRRAGMREC